MEEIFLIKIDPTRCVGCGLCAHDCFPDALAFGDNKVVLATPENCIGCGHCIAICPQNAVSDDTLPLDDISPLTVFHQSEDLLGLMRSRRSCRHYTSEPVSQTITEKLLAAARACPTAKNSQDTRYILVRKNIPKLLDAALATLGDLGLKQKATAAEPGELRRAENFIRWSELRMTDKTFDPLFFHAPLLMLFISDRGDPRDAAAAASYVELLASAMGLGCLYSGYFTACAAGNMEIANILGLSPQEQVVRCLVLGYPNVHFQRTAPRKALNITEL